MVEILPVIIVVVEAVPVVRSGWQVEVLKIMDNWKPVGVDLNRVELQILMVRVVELLLIVMERLKLVLMMSQVIRFSIVMIILCTRIMTVPFPCEVIQV